MQRRGLLLSLYFRLCPAGRPHPWPPFPNTAKMIRPLWARKGRDPKSAEKQSHCQRLGQCFPSFSHLLLTESTWLAPANWNASCGDLVTSSQSQLGFHPHTRPTVTQNLNQNTLPHLGCSVFHTQGLRCLFPFFRSWLCYLYWCSRVKDFIEGTS